MDEPFGRQPKPVEVTLIGEDIDVDYWMSQLMRRAEFKGDMVQLKHGSAFIIYPRAVND
jgi:hypothetical protein